MTTDDCELETLLAEEDRKSWCDALGLLFGFAGTYWMTRSADDVVPLFSSVGYLESKLNHCHRNGTVPPSAEQLNLTDEQTELLAHALGVACCSKEPSEIERRLVDLAAFVRGVVDVRNLVPIIEGV